MIDSGDNHSELHANGDDKPNGTHKEPGEHNQFLQNRGFHCNIGEVNHNAAHAEVNHTSAEFSK